MKIVIDNMIRIYGYDKFLLNLVKQRFMYPNPEYNDVLKRKKRYVSEFINTFKVDDSLILYRGVADWLKSVLKMYKYNYEFVDKRLLLPTIDVKSSIVLKPNQIKPFNLIVNKYQGILEGPPGSGKTILGISLIAYYRQPTLVLTHTSIIFKQWQEQIKKFLNYDCGVLGGGKKEIKDITVGMFQTVYNMLSKNKNDDILRRFGCIIIDETQHLAARTFEFVVNKFPAKYRYGLSATPYRKDKLDFIFKDILGDIIAKIESDVKAVVRIVEDDSFKFFYVDKTDWARMISALVCNKYRNMRIVKNILNDVEEKCQILVLTERVKHCEILKRMLKEFNVDSEIIISSSSKIERERIKNDFLKGKSKIIIGTAKLIAEGLDISNVDRIHIASPINNKGTLIQIIGRGQRNIDTKNLVVYDYIDMKCLPLKTIVIYNHKKWYNELNYKVEGFKEEWLHENYKKRKSVF